MTAHVGGAPVEELLFPLLVTGAPMFLLAARVALTRVLRRADPRRTPPVP
jgi:hypothetical protein